VWTQQAKLVGTGAIGNAEQGYSVSLSDDGNTALVGGIADNDWTGAAWVFKRSGRVWTQQAKLVGTGAISGPFGGAKQGFAVSLSSDGNTAIVGGPADDNGASNGSNINPGAVWVFTRSGGVWTQQAKLIAPDAIGNAGQGVSVSLSGGGRHAIVGGPYDNVQAGAAWVYVSFAGIPSTASCHGRSVSALVQQYRGLGAAAATLGYSRVAALQNAIVIYCAE
jgi:hypothetical protein